MKSFVKNRAALEGCIAECYVGDRLFHLLNGIMVKPCAMSVCLELTITQTISALTRCFPQLESQ